MVRGICGFSPSYMMLVSFFEAAFVPVDCEWETKARTKAMFVGVDSPFVFSHFPRVFGGFLERRIPGFRMGKLPLGSYPQLSISCLCFFLRLPFSLWAWIASGKAKGTPTPC